MTDEIKNQETHSVSENSIVNDIKNESNSRDVKWREKSKILQEENMNLKTELNKKDEDYSNLAKRLEAVETSSQLTQRKRIEAEIKAMAISEGLQDLDLLKVFDMGTVNINEDGDIVGASEMISEMKSKKPNWFEKEKKLSSSSNIKIAPNEEAQKNTDAYGMTQDEWKRFRSQYI